MESSPPHSPPLPHTHNRGSSSRNERSGQKDLTWLAQFQFWVSALWLRQRIWGHIWGYLETSPWENYPSYLCLAPFSAYASDGALHPEPCCWGLLIQAGRPPGWACFQVPQGLLSSMRPFLAIRDISPSFQLPTLSWKFPLLSWPSGTHWCLYQSPAFIRLYALWTSGACGKVSMEAEPAHFWSESVGEGD